MCKKFFITLTVAAVFCAGFFFGASMKPTESTFHDMIVNRPHELSSLITPDDKRVLELATELMTPENAFAYVRDRIGDDPSLSAQPAGEVLAEGRASCLGKAALLCSLYRSMGVPHENVRVVTGELAYPGRIIDHAWVEIEHKGNCFQQDASNFIGHFEFAEFPGESYTRSFVSEEGYTFNDVDFAVISRLNQMKGGHPAVQ